jgi:hypothetical protein
LVLDPQLLMGIGMTRGRGVMAHGEEDTAFEKEE